MLWGWLLDVAILAFWVVSLRAFERTTTITGKIATGIAAMILGVTGFVWLATMVSIQF